VNFGYTPSVFFFFLHLLAERVDMVEMRFIEFPLLASKKFKNFMGESVNKYPSTDLFKEECKLSAYKSGALFRFSKI